MADGVVEQFWNASTGVALPLSTNVPETLGHVAPYIWSRGHQEKSADKRDLETRIYRTVLGGKY